MNIVAITSCATGIAHTYMAAEAIKKICKKNGHTAKVETQGAMGLENKLSEKEIAAADYIIFANDVKIAKIERFDAYKDKIKQTSPHEVIKHPEIILELIGQ